MSSADFYRSFHTHPVNKFIHVICIPMIVLSTLNFLSKLSIRYSFSNKFSYLGRNKITLVVNDYTIIFLYTMYYYIAWNWRIGFIMQLYVTFLSVIGILWRETDNKWLNNSIIMFTSAWIMQFIGHAIEGNRPALMTSLVQSIFQAPLFTLEYMYPSLLPVAV